MTNAKACRKFHFTEKRVLELPPAPPSKYGTRDFYYDDEVRGLCVAVGPTGTKTFVLYRYVAGKPERIKIGRIEDFTVEQARTEAQRMNGEIGRGKNPATELRTVRDEMTLDELFQTWLLLFAKANKRTWESDQWMFDKYLHAWRLRKISSIAKMDVVKLHKHIGETRGQSSANRVVELLCAMYNRAKTDWGWTGTNPTDRVRAFKEKPRARFMDGDELPAFFKSLAIEPNRVIRDFFLIALLTGARRSNVQAM